MSKITKYEQNELIKKHLIDDLGVDSLNVGEIFINPSDSRIAIKITGVEFEDHNYANQDICGKIYILYQETENYELSAWETQVKRFSYNDFKIYWYDRSVRVRVGQNVADYLDKARKMMSGELDVTSLSDTDTDSTLQNEYALISKNSKTNLTTLQNSLEEKKKHAELIQAFVSIEMEKKKRELDAIRQKMYGVIEVFKKKIGRIMRVITTIELYLGIDEELFQIQEGELAPQDTPISFRQAVLYMDEEIGHYENGGLDFTDIKWFDEWLIKDSNYKKLLPELKGLVVFRPRRYDKDYGSDPRYNAAMNRENMYRTYLLIRNGDCLFRVYTENIVILPRLFPKRDELQKLMLEIQKENMSSWEEEKKKDNIDDLLHQYKKRAILMQGLIDRTEVFHPLPVEKVNLFDMENLEGKVNFIYDDEAALPSGRLTFWDWHKKINSKIGKGSRVLITSVSKRDRDVKDRIYYYCNEYNTPDMPSTGIYEVEEYLHKDTISYNQSEFEKKKEIWDANGTPYTIIHTRKNAHIINWDKNEPEQYEDIVRVESTFTHLTILYNPGGTVYGPWGTYDPHDRKKRIRLRIYPDDRFVLNYDQISLEDINFYLTSRIDRPNYLSMLPILCDMKKWRIEEIENEKNFATMVYGQIYKKLKSSEEEIYKQIWSAIDWWKFKNLWKRPIDKDDSKALRMIIKHIIHKPI
jgi:hypothetical protein